MELPNLINQIELLTQELTDLQPLAAEQQEKLDKKFRLEFNYNSNHIEGNTLTYGETESYIFFDRIMADHTGREYEEMKASDLALRLVKEYSADDERPLTEAFIKDLNRIILVRPYWANAITADGQKTQRLISIGDYKKHPNSVRLQNGEMFNYASPQETPSLMGDMLMHYREELEKKEHPILIAALLHYRFVRIHPFDDGNGRLSRLLMNYVLFAHNLPPVIIRSDDKDNYLSALNKADSGDINAFVEYVAKQLVWSLELSIKAAKGEPIEDSNDIEKEIALWKQELQNKNPIDALPKSPEIVQKLYDENLGPILESLEKKIFSLFKDLFNSWNVLGIVNNRSSGGKSYIDSTISHPFEDIFSVALNIRFDGFKKNLKNQFGVSVRLEVLFNPNNYQIKVLTDGGVKIYLDGGRIYNLKVTEQEQNEIINDTVKHIFNYIKEHTEI